MYTVPSFGNTTLLKQRQRESRTAGKGLESSLYGMKSLDSVSYAFAIAGVALVALLASAVPAGRAANVDPTNALRME